MKRSVFFFFFFMALGISVFAQLDIKPAVGINISRFDSKPVFGTDTLSTDSRAGYQVGASVAIGRKLYIEPGIFYINRNQGFTSQDIEIENPKFTYNANYLRIPLNVGFQFIGSTTSFAGLKIFVGPSMYIPLSVKENDYPITKDDVKSPEFDFSVGAGINIWLLFLDISYGWDMTQQFKNDPITAKMQGFNANLGFRFRIKKDEE